MTDRPLLDETKHYSRATMWVRECGVKGIEGHILHHIAAWCEHSGECGIAQSTIADTLGYSRDAVVKALGRLDTDGYIHTEKGAGPKSPTTGRRMNLYTLNIDHSMFGNVHWFAGVDERWAKEKGVKTDEVSCREAFTAYRFTAFKAGKSKDDIGKAAAWYWTTHRRKRSRDKMPSLRNWFLHGDWKLYFDRKGKKPVPKTKPSRKIPPTRNQNVG